MPSSKLVDNSKRLVNGTYRRSILLLLQPQTPLTTIAEGYKALDRGMPQGKKPYVRYIILRRSTMAHLQTVYGGNGGWKAAEVSTMRPKPAQTSELIWLLVSEIVSSDLPDHSPSRERTTLLLMNRHA